MSSELETVMGLELPLIDPETVRQAMLYRAAREFIIRDFTDRGFIRSKAEQMTDERIGWMMGQLQQESQ